MADGSYSRQLEQVVALVSDVLGDAIVGVYLTGSAVTGGLRPRSDIDVVVVTNRSTTHEEKRRISDGLQEISNRDDTPGFERPIELTIAAQPDVRPWRYPPRTDFQFGEWLRDRFERGDLEPEKPTNPDLAILLESVLRASESMIGPPAVDVLDGVPSADLRRAMTDELPSLLADLDTDTRNVVLTLARVWLTVVTGEIRSKDAAADWVLIRLPSEHRPVLVRARAIYLGDQPERWDDLRDRVRPFAEHVLGSIRAAPPN